MKNAVLFSEAERALPGPGARASRQTTPLDKEASTATRHHCWPLNFVQRVHLHGCNRWGKPSWLRLDLENEVIFIFPCLSFPIYPVVAIYRPLSRGALKPLNVVSSRLGKSWLHTLIGVGLLLMGDSPETSLMPARVLNSCQPLEVRPFIQRQITCLGG